MTEQKKVVQPVNSADISITVKWGSEFSNSSFVISAPGLEPVEVPFAMIQERIDKKKLSK